MKVLVSAYSCVRDPDERFGSGGEGYLGWNMVNQISKLNETFVLTHFKNKGKIEKKLKEYPIETAKFFYIKLPFIFEYLNKFHGGIQLYAYLWQIKAYFVAKKLHKKFKFDFFHHVTYANDWMASFVGALLPIPYIRGPGGGAHKIPEAFLENYSIKEKIIERLRDFGQWIFKHDPFFIVSQRKARAILVCNKESFEALSKNLQEKAFFFPVVGIIKEDLEIPVKKKNGKFLIVSAGKLLKLKRFDLAIKAFKDFNSIIRESELMIIGSGPESENLKKLSKILSLEAQVTFKEWMSREELLKKIAEADVFLFPSLRDGGGAVVVEAMALSKPVICFDISGPGFHIQKEWGIKIKPENENQAIREIKEALENLYYNELLRVSLGRAAKKRAEEFYLWDRLGKNLKDIYGKVIKN